MSGNRTSYHSKVTVIDHSITINIFILDITWGNIAKLIRMIVYFFLRLKQAFIYITEERTYRITFSIYCQSCVFDSSHVHNFIANIRIIQHNTVVKVAYLITIINHQFKAFIYNFTSILERCTKTYGLRYI